MITIKLKYSQEKILIIFLLAIVCLILILQKSDTKSTTGDEFGSIWLASQDMSFSQIIEFIHKYLFKTASDFCKRSTFNVLINPISNNKDKNYFQSIYLKSI